MSDDHVVIFKLIVVHKKTTKNKDFYNPLKLKIKLDIKTLQTPWWHLLWIIYTAMWIHLLAVTSKRLSLDNFSTHFISELI